ncbi:hypothetical protein OROHE_023368 [Orobanche hederae]
MADPYESNESEDISSFLQILLHNSSSSAATADSAASASGGGLFCGAEAPEPMLKCFPGINLPDPRNFIARETHKFNPYINLKNMVSSCEESGTSEIRTNSAPPRSSKRSRAAEAHNLSEKRRRGRINEKLKALQSLIPNSSKTDKTSMLDEAIEYLKQLQLQVQMLTMRNRLSLHPGYSLGSLQSTLVPPSEPELVNENVLMQNAMEENINHGYSTQQIRMPSMANNISHSGLLPSIVPSLENHYGQFSHLAAPKDVCHDNTLSRLKLDISCSRNNSS